MRKELVVASIIGIGFGLVIAYGAYRVNSSFKKDNTATNQTPKPKEVTSEFKITLDKPQNNDVVTESSITISGITKPLVWVTVSGVDSDYIVQSDDHGVFGQDVDLVPGINQIKITAFDGAGLQSLEKVLVVYSSSFQENNIQSDSPDASSDSAIKLKVEEKVIEALNKPKAYIGVVTDIADSTIQIKTSESQIEQISVKNDNITVVKTGTTNKTVKLADIAIGDFIVAMGYVNSNSVLNAQRIIVTDPIKDQAVDVNLGTVKSIVKKVVTIETATDKSQVDIQTDSKTNFVKLSDKKATKLKLLDIFPNDLVIYVQDKSGDTPTTRTVFVIQKS